MAKYTLTDIFEGNYPVSQYFGQRPEYYKQFGLLGHEGVDWATPVGSPMLCPFDVGIVIRDDDDPKLGAYGNHLVIWDKRQKCAVWYCHLSKNNVKPGDIIQKGEVVALSGNSGNSTGAHVHVNFVETDANGNRLNMTNGYQGFLNILDANLVKWRLGEQAKETTQPVPKPFEFSDQTIIPLGKDIGNMELQAVKSIILDQEKNLDVLARENIELEDLLEKLTHQLEQAMITNKLQADQIRQLNDDIKKAKNTPKTAENPVGGELHTFKHDWVYLFARELDRKLP